eukprot:tig00021014_g17086.t1
MENEEIMQWVYVTLRLHHLKQLRWYTKSARQPRDVGHIVNQLSMRMSTAAVFGKNPACRRLARMCIPYLSKGGGNGEQIRLEILAIMRRHGIKEGHRPGIDCKFLEQWHQKLHQNTTIEDIAIADAYIHFLESGSPGAFWWALWEWHKIPKERLAKWTTPITHDPLHLPQLINDIKHYRWILKTVHANDFGYLLETGKWALEKAGENALVGEIYEVLRNQSEWWIRQRMQGPMKNVYQGERDILMIDGALETTFRVQLERAEVAEKLDRDALIDIFDLILSQSSLSREHHPEWEGVLKQWRKMVKEAGPRWTQEWCLRAKAAAERAGLLLASEAELYQQVLQPKAEILAKAVPEVDQAYITNFVEEIIRGQPSSILSQILMKLEPQFREGAGMGKWQVVSAGRTGAATGEIMVIPDFAEVQGKSYAAGPAKIAVLAAGSADVLSHVAIRARNQGVLLAYCDCTETLNKLRGQHKERDFVLVRIDATGGVELKEGHHAPAPANGAGKASPAPGGFAIPAPKAWPGYFLAAKDFEKGLVGGKSLHLKKLGDALAGIGGADSAGIKLPEGFAVPFGSFEKALGPSSAELAAKKGGAAKADEAPATPAEALIRTIEALLRPRARPTRPASAPPCRRRSRRRGGHRRVGAEAAAPAKPKVKKALPDAVEALAAEAREAHARGDGAAMSAALAELRADIVERLEAPKEARAAVERIVEGLGVAPRSAPPLRRPLDEARRPPAPRSPGPDGCARRPCSVKRVWSSKWTDRAVLSAPPWPCPTARSPPPPPAPPLSSPPPSRRPPTRRAPQILSGRAVRLGGLGARSEERALSYADEALFWDAALRETIVKRLAAVGLAVERAMGGSPQDVEGVWGLDGSITVVQTRPRELSHGRSRGRDPPALALLPDRIGNRYRRDVDVHVRAGAALANATFRVA